MTAAAYWTHSHCLNCDHNTLVTLIEVEQHVCFQCRSVQGSPAAALRLTRDSSSHKWLTGLEQASDLAGVQHGSGFDQVW